jgi:hypothetical protein
MPRGERKHISEETHRYQINHCERSLARKEKSPFYVRSLNLFFLADSSKASRAKAYALKHEENVAKNNN